MSTEEGVLCTMGHQSVHSYTTLPLTYITIHIFLEQNLISNNFYQLMNARIKRIILTEYEKNNLEHINLTCLTFKV